MIMKKIKKFFETPKKAVISCAVIILGLACLGTVSVFAAGTIAKNTAIGEAKAQNFAFADAGVDPASAYVEYTEFEFEHGQFIYEVDFVAAGTEYEYWVSAFDGTIVKKESKLVSANSTNVTAKVTLEQAKATALEDAALTADQVTFTKENVDYDDGTMMYDIEFFSDNTKFEYEINAVTGVIYSKSKESLNNAAVSSGTGTQTDTTTTSVPQDQNNSTQTTNGQIDLETAKTNALADAGVSAADVTFTKEKLDYDDGVAVYDIEFYTSTNEYEYEINAETGAVYNKSVEALKQTAAQSGSQSGTSNIDVDKAKSIALEQAGASADEVTFTKAKLDHDDGFVYYEVEFYYNGMEYEYKIDSSTGAVLEYDHDHAH